ncbi:hypothetical protein CFC21_020828 [Triticum aestivum]|uniref:Protein kinase domain-containing protein n=2 Tax=Triticum aestivum TaxID=4565 RepID=A0A9R1E8N8_WHEAT|nr:putative receptor-like protein kinase At4g00960 [Triticum aestivum]XP_044318914.1 putative receptor-like protein kinase At4g00960 [Triticum aestivum]KAF7005721.1 hypothetical protein CFC21_020828 [Triticum aestivum]
MDLQLHLIETITNDFSEYQKVGSGGYGDVYKAVYKGEEIAVKKLHPLQGLDDKQFHSELLNLTKVSHKNVVRLIGYCYESRHKYVKNNGETIWAKSMERVLCFEYMQGGSLEKHIADESCELDWPTCYNIIRGTCEGLNHLHSAPDNPIFHLDLKPANILLDKSMTPKIADLGLSRVFASSETHQTEIVKGTHGYMPPEYVAHRRISKKFDVFSLGVIIIKMVAGNTDYSDMPPKEFIKLARENWTKRLQAMPDSYSSHEVDILRVTKCVEIALRCVDKDRDKRPCIKDIVQELEELEAEIQKMLQTSDLSENLTVQRSRGTNILSVDPTLEMRFLFEPRKEVSCCLQLTNKTDDFIAFNVNINRPKYHTRPSRGTMPPCSKRYIAITLRAQAVAPLNMQCHDMLLVQSIRINQELASDPDKIDYQELFEVVVEDDVVKLPIVYVTAEQ